MRLGFQGQAGGAAPEPSGPGVTEVTAVDNSIVLVLKPNELAKKKRKFKQVCWTVTLLTVPLFLS